AHRPRSSRQISNVAEKGKKAPPDARSREADLELEAGFCPCEGTPSTQKPLVDANDRRSGWHRSCRAPPAEPSSIVAGGPRVRIHLPPAGSLVRTASSNQSRKL